MRSDALVAGRTCAANTNNVQAIQTQPSNTIDSDDAARSPAKAQTLIRPNKPTNTASCAPKPATTSSDRPMAQQVCSAKFSGSCNCFCLCANVWPTNRTINGKNKSNSIAHRHKRTCCRDQFVDTGELNETLLAKCKQATHRVAAMAKTNSQVSYKNRIPMFIQRLPSSASLSDSTKSTSDESKIGLSGHSCQLDSTSSNPTTTTASICSPANSLASTSKLSTSSASSCSLGSISSSLVSSIGSSSEQWHRPCAKGSRKRSYRVDMSDFDLLKVLGTGAYGKVFLVRKLNGHDKGKLYAMKVLNKEIVAQKTKTLDHTRTERKVLEAIRNEPFLVTMHYAFQTKSKLHLILDYVNGGELFTHLYQRDHFKEDDVRIYVGELVLALDKLHKVSLRC